MTTLKEIFSHTLEIDQEAVNDRLMREQLPSWDSFNHLLLISEIEKQLQVHFTMAEVLSIQSYKDLQQLTDVKLQK